MISKYVKAGLAALFLSVAATNAQAVVINSLDATYDDGTTVSFSFADYDYVGGSATVAVDAISFTHTGTSADDFALDLNTASWSLGDITFDVGALNLFSYDILGMGASFYAGFSEPNLLDIASFLDGSSASLLLTGLSFSTAAVPAPATLPLMAVGLAGLAMLRRRKQPVALAVA